MFFERIKTPGIAQVAYILAADGDALVVDPCRDVQRYLTILQNSSLRLRYVVQTHRHEDFEMGGAALRQLTGAEIVAGKHDIFRHADVRLGDGETLQLGTLTLRALHTPGHTPESMCYAVYLAANPELAWGVFTGDALFIGDTGRTDLPAADKAVENAGRLYDALHDKVFPLGDQTLVFPAHGAGSACGGQVADRDDSTIGIERVSNAAATMGREAFVRYKGHEQHARPPYFRVMEQVNLDGGRALDERPVPWLPPQSFRELSQTGVVIDTREAEAFAGGHIASAYSIWLAGLSRYGGWITDPVSLYLVVDEPGQLHEARLALARIGHDNVAGALANGFSAWRAAGQAIETSGTITPAQLNAASGHYNVLDVREAGEFEAGHIPAAQHVFVGELAHWLGEMALDTDTPLAVTCSVGHRSSFGVSILKRHGYSNVSNLLGGMTAWHRLGLPIDRPGT